MKKLLLLALVLTLLTTVFSGCASTAASKESDTITIAWYPNESGEDLKAARDEFGKLIEKATGKKVEHKLTTDYVIAIEAIASGNADLAFMGAQGYIEAHKKNEKVLPLVVNSGKSGTLDDAIYYSWLAVKKGNESGYKSGDAFRIDNIAGKRFSFVSNSSTSGFKVPCSNIVGYFNKLDQYKNLKQDDLIEGGKFFKEVLYGGSHQGSTVNILTDKADVAAFCDTSLANYIELSEGTENTVGAIYKIRKDAAEPFEKLIGQEFVLISVSPVLNTPFAINTGKIGEKTMKALLEALTNDETANNPKIFVPKDSEFKGMFKQEGKSRFVEAKDDWFNPIRDLSK